MKFVTEEQSQEHFNATIEGGLKGLVVAAGVTVPTFMLLNRRWPTFRAAPLPMKAFGVVVLGVPCVSIFAEKAGEAYDRSQWTGIGLRELEYQAQKEHERRDALTFGGQLTDWARRRKWALITGSWAAAMIGSFVAVDRAYKVQSFSQKLVKARVYAQAWTIAILIVAAIASGTGVAQDDVIGAKAHDHSWREILEQEGYGDQLKELKPHELHQLAQQVKSKKEKEAKAV